MYKSCGLCAIFHLFGAASILVWLLFLRAAYMQCCESAKPVKAVWHGVTCTVKAKLNFVNVTKLQLPLNKVLQPPAVIQRRQVPEQYSALQIRLVAEEQQRELCHQVVDPQEISSLQQCSEEMRPLFG